MKYVMIVTSLFLSTSAFAFDAPDFYQKKCAKCHGKTGEGDGRAVRTLNHAPKSFKDKSIMEPDSKGRQWEARFFGAIKNGGPSVDQTKEMDAYSDLSDDDVKAMVEFIKKEFMGQ